MLLNILIVSSLIFLVGLGIKKFSKKPSSTKKSFDLYSEMKIKPNFIYYWNLFKNDILLLGIFIILWYLWEQLMSFLYSNNNPENIDLAPLYSFEDISIIFFGLYSTFLIIRFSIIFTQIINKPFADYLENKVGNDFSILTPWQKILTVLIFICLFSLVASLSMLAI